MQKRRELYPSTNGIVPIAAIGAIGLGLVGCGSEADSKLATETTPAAHCSYEVGIAESLTFIAEEYLDVNTGDADATGAIGNVIKSISPSMDGRSLNDIDFGQILYFTEEQCSTAIANGAEVIMLHPDDNATVNDPIE